MNKGGKHVQELHAVTQGRRDVLMVRWALKIVRLVSGFKTFRTFGNFAAEIRRLRRFECGKGGLENLCRMWIGNMQCYHLFSFWCQQPFLDSGGINQGFKGNGRKKRIPPPPFPWIHYLSPKR